jgi:hypothetical protein
MIMSPMHLSTSVSTTYLQAGQDSLGILVASEIMRGCTSRSRSSSRLSSAGANAVTNSLVDLILGFLLGIPLTIGHAISNGLSKRKREGEVSRWYCIPKQEPGRSLSLNSISAMVTPHVNDANGAILCPQPTLHTRSRQYRTNW